MAHRINPPATLIFQIADKSPPFRQAAVIAEVSLIILCMVMANYTFQVVISSQLLSLIPIKQVYLGEARLCRFPFGTQSNVLRLFDIQFSKNSYGMELVHVIVMEFLRLLKSK